MTREEATYQYVEEKHGNGMFFFTSCCGNRMYSVKDKYAYDGAYCPKCYMKNRVVVLHLADAERD